MFKMDFGIGITKLSVNIFVFWFWDPYYNISEIVLGLLKLIALDSLQYGKKICALSLRNIFFIFEHYFI